jgi:7-keto-8-aminopelargonate synthetase-like enzyme
MKGDMAPLRELYEIAALQGGLLVIDDAHATGTMGRSGRGGLEQIDLPFDPEHMIVTGTFSKAMGSLGGFAVLAEEASRTLASTARTLIYTTALPPGVLAASLEALRLIESSPVMVEKLQEASLYWQRSLTGRESLSPIIALSGDPSRLSGLSKEMGLRGFHLPLLTYPTVPKGEETLRLSVNTNWDETVVSALEDILTPERRGFR